LILSGVVLRTPAIMPAASAPNCVPVQISADWPSSATLTTQFIGSICGWEQYSDQYVASTTFAAPLSALAASPTSYSTMVLASGSLPLRAYSSLPFSESVFAAAAPVVSHLTLSALRPALVASTVSPITATPNGSGITLVTPLMAVTSPMLRTSTLAPSTGASNTEA